MGFVSVVRILSVLTAAKHHTSTVELSGTSTPGRGLLDGHIDERAPLVACEALSSDTPSPQDLFRESLTTLTYGTSARRSIRLVSLPCGKQYLCRYIAVK